MTAVSKSSKFQPDKQDNNIKAQLSERLQAPTTSSQNKDNTQKVENVQKRKECHDSSFTSSQNADNTLQSFEDDPVAHMETTGPVAATEVSASTSTQFPKAHAAESFVNESAAMDCTGLELDDKSDQQSSADRNQRPFVNSSLDATPERGIQPFETPTGGLAEDGENHGNEKQAVNTAKTATSIATDTTAVTEKSGTVYPPSASNSQPGALPSQSPPALTPQEITLAELKAQKASLLASLATLPAIRGLMEEHESPDMDTSDNDEPTEADVMAAVNKIVKNHIKLLHEYNELKDTGQGLMGLIADQRGVRIVEVQDEFGIDAND
jgi:hypothetical protein